MDLELGIAVSCSPEGCRVELLDGITIDTRHSAPVLDTVKIRARQLVVVDRGVAPPELVYRVALVGEVVSTEGGRIEVVRHGGSGEPLDDGKRTRVVLSSNDPAVARGDAVFFAGGEPGKLVDVIMDGRPSGPEDLRDDVYERVEELYAKLAS